MSVLRRIIRKKNGAKETVHLGALAKNVTQDATHRFVSDTEKQTWNGKANPGDIPSGAAADYGVANNDTTNRSDMLVTAQVAYQHGKEIDQLNSDLGGCRFGYTEDGLPGYKKDGADTVYPFSSVRSISGVFSAYLPAGNMECHAIISRPENTSIKKVTIQINRQIAGQTYIRVISNKGDTPTTIAQYSFAVQPPGLNQDIPFDISDNPDNIEIQAQTIPAGIMQQTNVPYTIEFSHTGT